MKALLLAPMGSVHRRFNKANIAALKSLGYQVHLAANFEDGEGTEKQNREFIEQCMAEGIVTHSIAYKRHSLMGSLSKTGETRKLLNEEQFDLVHAHTETGGLILRLAGKPCKNARYIYTPHGMSFYEGSSLKSQVLYRPVEHWICAAMDSNIAINGDEFEILKKWNRSSACFVHGAGVNLDRFKKAAVSEEMIRKEFEIPADAKVVISVGELDDNKNHQVIIRAIAALSRKDVYYIICGIGPNENELQRLSVSLGIQDRVILAGYRKDIPEILYAGDVFAFPSFHEGLPVSLMEAMASGLPVICSDIRGSTDLIERGKGGYLCPPEDVMSFSDSLMRIISEEDKGNVFSDWNRKKVKQYSYENVLAELKAVYRG